MMSKCGECQSFYLQPSIIRLSLVWKGVEMPLPSRMHLASEVLGYVVVVSCPEGFVQGCETRNFDIRN